MMVMKMKNYLKIVIGAIFIGGIMAFFFYHDIKKEVIAISNPEKSVYVFQVGVFKSLENAQKFVQNYPSGEIYRDKDIYRIIIAATITNKEKLEIHFKNNEIEYFVKEFSLTKDLDKIKEYDELLSKTDKPEVINSINKSSVALFLRLVT